MHLLILQPLDLDRNSAALISIKQPPSRLRFESCHTLQLLLNTPTSACNISRDRIRRPSEHTQQHAHSAGAVQGSFYKCRARLGRR